jgi:GTP-binding protein Era
MQITNHSDYRATNKTGRSAKFRSGFVAIAGAPNVGKSTLLNKILGQKVSITSKKPQTTRSRIIGIVHRPFSQIAFIDTPGIHPAEGMFNIRIVDTAYSAFADADVILVVADASKPSQRSERVLIKTLKKSKRPAVLALNKIDLVEKAAIVAVAERWKRVHPFEMTVAVSARHGTGLEQMLNAIEARLPIGPPYFPEAFLTDMPQRFIAAEIIREQVFRCTGREIPYAVAVTVDSFLEDEKPSMVIVHATIHVERDSQKGIMIGKNGQKLKKIGEAARKAIEGTVGKRVFLKLFVRVQKNWTKDPKALRKFGY